jgi:hypothetical protein
MLLFAPSCLYPPPPPPPSPLNPPPPTPTPTASLFVASFIKMRTSFPLLPRPYRAPGGLFIWIIAGQTPSCPTPPRASTTAGAVIVLLSIANIVTALNPRLLQPRDDSAQPDADADAADTSFQVSVFGGVLLAGLVFDAGHTLWRSSRSSGQPAPFHSPAPHPHPRPNSSQMPCATGRYLCCATQTRAPTALQSALCAAMARRTRRRSKNKTGRRRKRGRNCKRLLHVQNFCSCLRRRSAKMRVDENARLNQRGGFHRRRSEKA